MTLVADSDFLLFEGFSIFAVVVLRLAPERLRVAVAVTRLALVLTLGLLVDFDLATAIVFFLVAPREAEAFFFRAAETAFTARFTFLAADLTVFFLVIFLANVSLQPPKPQQL